MEFDIGTLFYILITIVAIVASVLGKKKKPVDGEAASDDESGPFGFFSKLEEQIGGMVDDTKEEEAQPVAEEVIAAEKSDGNRIHQDQGGYDWQSVSFDGDTATSGDYYNEFEGFYDAEKKENLKSIIEEAEKSASEENLEVIDMDDITNPDYFEIAREFDLGTAVIYSTIINRKEY